jgi:DtxR family Mn-dependent transcriptional regulator
MTDVMTPGIEEYLEAIFNLQEAGETASTKALAERLKLKAPSVTEMVKKMASQKLVKHTPYKGVTLTDKGTAAAAVLVRRHRLSERFLADMLGVPWDQIHDEACKFEHVISETVEEKLLEALGNPTTCPHGNPIPGADGAVEPDISEPLAMMQPKSKGTISRITDESPEFLQYLAELGLMPNMSVEIEQVAPFGGPIVVKTRGASYAIGRQVADHIYVRPGKPKTA